MNTVKKFLDVLQSKKWTTMLIAVLIVLMGVSVFQGIRFFDRIETNEKISMIIDGEYSIDGGEWKPIDYNHEINETFHKAVFRGKLINDIWLFKTVNISSKNVWYKLSSGDGEIINHFYVSAEKQYQTHVEVTKTLRPEAMVESFEEFKNTALSAQALSVNMPNTPGYIVEDIDMEPYHMLYDNEEEPSDYVLEVVYPYSAPATTFSDCFQINISDANGIYTQFFFHALPPILLFILVCFFGIFFFPIASFILGKKDYKYLTFGLLCFCWGLSVIMHNISGYLNMWITDHSICLLIATLPNYFLIISIIIYLKSNLTNRLYRAISNISATVFTVMTVAFVLLHFFAVIDIYASSPIMMAATAVCAIVPAVFLMLETRIDKKAYFILVGWIPLALAILVDAVNHYVHFASIDFYNFGLAITMVYQIIRLVLDLRTQYKEAIRYQQMQKELYEAKVSVMVSQIQPHFLYNSLSSIAMLCKLDPDTAYEATITFTQYLRSNMDSLKQKAPVPFEQELDHLKKYLYIEKLRFGKKLNIEYDIQTTDFELPQLSVQPLAENAVKHGISKKRGGGTLTIATRETETAYEVIVSDDGVGFDVNEVKNDGRSHIGMENIRNRLKEMCSAEVQISSVIGEGTVAKIIIPKKEETK